MGSKELMFKIGRLDTLALEVVKLAFTVLLVARIEVCVAFVVIEPEKRVSLSSDVLADNLSLTTGEVTPDLEENCPEVEASK